MPRRTMLASELRLEDLAGGGSAIGSQVPACPSSDILAVTMVRCNRKQLRLVDCHGVGVGLVTMT